MPARTVPCRRAQLSALTNCCGLLSLCGACPQAVLQHLRDSGVCATASSEVSGKGRQLRTSTGMHCQHWSALRGIVLHWCRG